MVWMHAHAQLVLRKCTWLKCCYGKKPYGAPPAIPWVPKCEFQKKLARPQDAKYGGEALIKYNKIHVSRAKIRILFVCSIIQKIRPPLYLAC